MARLPGEGSIMCKRAHRGLIVFVLGLGTSACATWRPAALPPREVVESGGEPVVRVTSVDGAVHQIRAPRSANDSIAVVSGACVGVGEAPHRRYVCPTRSVVAYDDVSLLEVRRRTEAGGAWAMHVAILFSALVILGMAANGCIGLCGT